MRSHARLSNKQSDRWVGVLLAFVALSASVFSERVEAQSRTIGAQTSPVQQSASRLEIDIKGMYCSSCEQTITSMLLRTPGVRRAQVSEKLARAVVTYDPKRATPATILATISKLGYQAKVRSSS